MKKIKFLVVGCGSIGLRHLGCLMTRKDAELAAVDVSKAAAKAVADIDKSIEFFADLKEALKWQPEITIICTPNNMHADATIAAFKAGSHVLCEKPIADTVKDGKRMVAAAKKYKKVLAVGYTERFRASIEHLERMVAKKELGNLIGGRAMVGTYNTLLCAKSNFRSKIFGILMVDYTHEIDMLRAVFGDVKSVTAKANSKAVKKLKTTPSLAAMLLEYKSGAVVTVHMDYVQHPQRRTLEVFGDKKVVEIDMQTDVMKIYDCNKEGYQSIQFDPIRNERFSAEHTDMVDAIRKRRKPRVDGAGAVEVLAVAEEAIKQVKK
ncbi:MAG: Gfo/Idh/MocA family protein [Planctomycetota bacterium]|jgi:predicted dehydrogenase